MKVQIPNEATFSEMEIEFPCYAESHYGDYHTSSHYRRITEVGGVLTTVNIVLQGRKVEVEVNPHQPIPAPRDAAYYFGLGEFESTAKRFNDALVKAKELLAGLEPLS